MATSFFLLGDRSKSKNLVREFVVHLFESVLLELLPPLSNCSSVKVNNLVWMWVSECSWKTHCCTWRNWMPVFSFFFFHLSSFSFSISSISSPVSLSHPFPSAPTLGTVAHSQALESVPPRARLLLRLQSANVLRRDDGLGKCSQNFFAFSFLSFFYCWILTTLEERERASSTTLRFADCPHYVILMF